jgi:hypothetical protein
MGDGSQRPKTRSWLLARRVQIGDVRRQLELAWPNLCVVHSSSPGDVTTDCSHRASSELLAYRESSEILSILR